MLLVNRAHACQAAGTAKGQPVIDAFVAAFTQDGQAYDSDTNHGRDAAAQTAWEGKIDSGALKFPTS